MRFFAWAVAALLLSSCTITKKSILLDVEHATPLDQRDLHKHCDLGDTAACTLAKANATEYPTKFAILQGLAPSDRAVFSALVPKNQPLFWFLYERDLGRLWKVSSIRLQMRSKGDWAVQRVEIRNLEPGRTYELLAGNQEGQLLEARVFRTLATEGKSSRIAFVSGLSRNSKDQSEKLFASLRSKKPHLIFFAGGNVDATFSQGKTDATRSDALSFFVESHARARATLPLAFEQLLTPVAAIWNEQEFGQGKGDRTFAYKDQAREAFEAFFPHWADEINLIDGPGLSLSFSLGEQLFAILDSLTFRKPYLVLPPVCAKKPKLEECNPPPNLNAAPGLRFGTLQSTWVFRQASRAKSPVWLLTNNLHHGAFRFQPTNAPDAATWMAELEERLYPAQTAQEPPSAFSLIETGLEGDQSKAQKTDFSFTGEVLNSLPLLPL